MLISLAIIIFAIALDQATKFIASSTIPLNSPDIVWIPNVLEFSYHHNDGMSFGLLEGQQVLFMIVTIIALLMFGYLFLDTDYKTKKIYSISIAFFIGGTIGNAIDRSLYGYVIDFMHFPFLDGFLNAVGLSNFYNNFADMFLSAAIVLFALDIFIFESKRKKKESPKDAETTEN